MMPVDLWWTWFRNVWAKLFHRPVPLRQDGADAIVEHLTECHPVDAVLVFDGSADPEIARLLAAGWTRAEGSQTEYVGGKRIRYLSPPEPSEVEQILRALAGDE